MSTNICRYTTCCTANVYIFVYIFTGAPIVIFSCFLTGCTRLYFFYNFVIFSVSFSSGPPKTMVLVRAGRFRPRVVGGRRFVSKGPISDYRFDTSNMKDRQTVAAINKMEADMIFYTGMQLIAAEMEEKRVSRRMGNPQTALKSNDDKRKKKKTKKFKKKSKRDHSA